MFLKKLIACAICLMLFSHVHATRDLKNGQATKQSGLSLRKNNPDDGLSKKELRQIMARLRAIKEQGRQA